MKVGDRVRVKGSVTVYHHPKNRNQAYDIGGMEGEIVSFANTYMMKGEEYPISANFPVYVQFDKKFKAHLREDEVETTPS